MKSKTLRSCSKAALLSLVLIVGQTSAFSQTHKVSTSGHTSRSKTTALNYLNDPSIGSLTDGHSSNGSKRSYNLLSNNISQLTPSSSTEDVTKAIKRAVNTKNHKDLAVIGDFLLFGVGDSFAYGYKGTLLARYAVAALRLNEYDLALQALQVRRERFAECATPFESAAILRGLLRLHKNSEAFDLLEEELSIVPDDPERLKYRAQALASIVSRNFFESNPDVALRACVCLKELGPIVRDAGLTAEELDMPWHRILLAADQCKVAKPDHQYDEAVVGSLKEFPLDKNFKKVFKRLKKDA